jgi:hypothetical protein
MPGFPQRSRLWNTPISLWARPVSREGAVVLVFFDDTSTNCGANSTHLRPCLGNGQMIEAGDPVQVNLVLGGFYGARLRSGRPPASMREIAVSGHHRFAGVRRQLNGPDPLHDGDTSFSRRPRRLCGRGGVRGATALRNQLGFQLATLDGSITGPSGLTLVGLSLAFRTHGPRRCSPHSGGLRRLVVTPPFHQWAALCTHCAVTTRLRLRFAEV